MTGKSQDTWIQWSHKSWLESLIRNINSQHSYLNLPENIVSGDSLDLPISVLAAELLISSAGHGSPGATAEHGHGLEGGVSLATALKRGIESKGLVTSLTYLDDLADDASLDLC